MTNKATKRALLTSVFSLLLCFVMLIGTTFAWFTDTVTSTGNIITSGTLDVEMYWADGTEAPASATWTDASTGAIFTYDNWEPGYVDVKHIKIANEGTLALKYKVTIAPEGEVSELADVIDVYYVDPATQVVDRAALANVPKLGTLREVLANLGATGEGKLEAENADTITLAFKMQETAGNEYQNKSIGTKFAVKLFATQLESEEDSFDAEYDEDSLFGDENGLYVEPDSGKYIAMSKSDLSKVAKLASNDETIEEVEYNGVDVPVVRNDADLTAAITAGNGIVVLTDDNFIIPNAAQGKTLTFVGAGDTKVATKSSGSYEGCNYALDGSTVTFDNITITTSGTTYVGYARAKITYNNCTINNTFTLYDDSTFNNCTFNVSGDSYNIWTWGAPNATFNNCVFNSDGKALLLYGQPNTKLTVNGCTFNDNGGLSDLKAAIEIGNDYNTSYELIVNNTTVNGYEINNKGINTGTTLWGNKNSMGTDKLNVVVDGVDVY